MRLRNGSHILVLSGLVMAVLALILFQPDNLETTNEALTYHGYFEVFDFFISSVFEDELRSSPNLTGIDWTDNSAHIGNAASQSNVIAVPHVVEDPWSYFYDPDYLDSCVENDLDIILYIHTLSKYVYFYDPRPCSREDRMDLLVEFFRIYEERLRDYRDRIVAIYVYDEPWVTPHNVTHEMLFDMADSARRVFWDKPVMVMFHRQGNAYQYVHPNGTIVKYDDWAGDMPGAFDIVGVDPYFYSYHDDKGPDYRQTGNTQMVESDVLWARDFGKPVILVGQAYDPGASMFFDRDNVDPRLSIHDGFEDWETGEPGGFGWSAGPGFESTQSLAYAGDRALLMWSPNSEASAVFEFERVNSVEISFRIYVDPAGAPSTWFALGDETGFPIRLGLQGRDLLIDDGTDVEIINRSVDMEPGKWHSIRISGNVDANRWKTWIDGDIQTRLPNAIAPSSFNRFSLLVTASSNRVWIDELRVERYWSHIPPNEEDTRLYYEVASNYPEVIGLMWWSYPHSFASHLIGEDGERLQVTDIWNVHREIWELID